MTVLRQPYQQRIIFITNEIQQIQIDLPDKEKFLSYLKNNEKIESNAEGDIKRATKEIDFYISNKSCPTCKQGIDEEFRKNSVEKKQEEKMTK